MEKLALKLHVKTARGRQRNRLSVWHCVSSELWVRLVVSSVGTSVSRHNIAVIFLVGAYTDG